jgi:hypothetical protein
MPKCGFDGAFVNSSFELNIDWALASACASSQNQRFSREMSLSSQTGIFQLRNISS